MKNTKVKQSTIDAIKKTGMTKALGSITPAQRKNAAYMTGLKRMYGAARVNKALGRSTTPTSRADRMSRPKKVARTADRMSTNPKRVSRTADRMITNPKRLSRTANRNTAKKTTTRGSVGAVQQALAARAPKSKMFSNLGAGVSVPRNYKKK